MWKPGTTKPSGSLTTTPKEKKMKKTLRPKLDICMSDDGDIKHSSTKKNTPSSATPRKRLSGGTMNMRFMKRKKSEIRANTNDDSEKLTPDSHTKAFSNARVQNNDAMDIVDKNGVSAEKDYKDGSKFSLATSVDMHGIEASLIGRRSFRGFNAPIERIWKDSKGYLEKRGAKDLPGKKVSDEELLLRYKDASMQRGSTGGRRGVGNLDKKIKNKKPVACYAQPIFLMIHAVFHQN